MVEWGREREPSVFVFVTMTLYKPPTLNFWTSNWSIRYQYFFIAAGDETGKRRGTAKCDVKNEKEKKNYLKRFCRKETLRRHTE